MKDKRLTGIQGDLILILFFFFTVGIFLDLSRYYEVGKPIRISSNNFSVSWIPFTLTVVFFSVFVYFMYPYIIKMHYYIVKLNKRCKRNAKKSKEQFEAKPEWLKKLEEYHQHVQLLFGQLTNVQEEKGGFFKIMHFFYTKETLQRTIISNIERLGEKMIAINPDHHLTQEMRKKYSQIFVTSKKFGRQNT